MKRILIFNAGSSSLKYKLFSLNDEDNLVLEKKGEVSKIGTDEGPKNHKMALSLLFQGFGQQHGFLNKIQDLVAIGHRVVHGGSKYQQTTLITQDVISDLKKYDKLAPLHNPPILEVMQQIYNVSGTKEHRAIPNYAVFDTSFYADLPEVTNIYPIPYHFHSEDGIERFGFHGLSHKNALNSTKELLKNKFKTLISVHLGAGSSITAINDNKAIDTSMGYTPNEGLMMATRCGDIDPGIILYLMQHKKMDVEEMSELLNSQSGLLGISEVSSDMKDLLYLAGYRVEDNTYQVPTRIKSLPEIYRKKSKLAIDMFIYRIKKYIGAYDAILVKTDVLVFTGKIGVGSSLIRNMIIEGMDHVLKGTKIIVVKTDEELQIAKEIIPCLEK